MPTIKCALLLCIGCSFFITSIKSMENENILHNIIENLVQKEISTELIIAQNFLNGLQENPHLARATKKLMHNIALEMKQTIYYCEIGQKPEPIDNIPHADLEILQQWARRQNTTTVQNLQEMVHKIQEVCAN